MYKIAAAARRRPLSFSWAYFWAFAALACDDHPSVRNSLILLPDPTGSEEASDVLAPCPGCRLAGCAVLVFSKNISNTSAVSSASWPVDTEFQQVSDLDSTLQAA